MIIKFRCCAFGEMKANRNSDIYPKISEGHLAFIKLLSSGRLKQQLDPLFETKKCILKIRSGKIIQNSICFNSDSLNYAKSSSYLHFYFIFLILHLSSTRRDALQYYRRKSHTLPSGNYKNVSSQQAMTKTPCLPIPFFSKTVIRQTGFALNILNMFWSRLACFVSKPHPIGKSHRSQPTRNWNFYDRLVY